MLTAAPETIPAKPAADDTTVHIVCSCDVSLALCGLDVTDEPWCDLDGDGCPLCLVVADAQPQCTRCGEMLR